MMNNTEFQNLIIFCGGEETSSYEDFSNTPQATPVKELARYGNDPIDNTLDLFSLQDVQAYLQESSSSPSDVLQRRLSSVAQYINQMDVEKVKSELPKLKLYIKSYLMDYVNKIVLMGKPISIILGLKLNLYLDNLASARKLQQAITISQKNVESNGSLTNDGRLQLNVAFDRLFDDLFKDYMSSLVLSDKVALIKEI